MRFKEHKINIKLDLSKHSITVRLGYETYIRILHHHLIETMSEF